MAFPGGMGENVGRMFSKSHGVNIRVPVEKEKVPSLEKNGYRCR